MCVYAYVYTHMHIGESTEGGLAEAHCLAQRKHSIKASCHFQQGKWGEKGLLERSNGAEA